MSDLRAVIWGAAGGVGAALLAALASSGRYGAVYAGSRTSLTPAPDGVRPFVFDLTEEASIAAAAVDIATEGPVDLVIVATGMLHQPGRGPEKRFAELNADAMLASFHVNAVGPALIAKHMIPALPKDRRSVFAPLSARVGSISDNRLGGWHSYRAGKAALNMMIANLAIELAHSRPQAIAVGLHPGTVDTALSLPFQKGVPAGQLFAPAVSAQHLLSVIDNLALIDSGSVLAWDGQRITP